MIQKLLLNTQMIWMIFTKTCNPIKKLKILILFDDMIKDMLSNEKPNPIVTELFIRGRKLNISFVFITQSYFAVSKNIRLNSLHYFVMKIPSQRELWKTAFHHSSDIDFQDLGSLEKSLVKRLLQNYIIFWLLILFLLQIILYVTERIFQK